MYDVGLWYFEVQAMSHPIQLWDPNQFHDPRFLVDSGNWDHEAFSGMFEDRPPPPTSKYIQSIKAIVPCQSALLNPYVCLPPRTVATVILFLLSRAFIASLPREEVTCAPDEEQQCPICLKNIEEGDRCGLDYLRAIAWHWPPTTSAWWPCLAAIRSMTPAWSLGCQRQRTVHCAGWTVEDSNFCSHIICLPHFQTLRAELPTDDPQWEEMKKQKKRKEKREEDLEALHNSMFG